MIDYAHNRSLLIAVSHREHVAAEEHRKTVRQITRADQFS